MATSSTHGIDERRFMTNQALERFAKLSFIRQNMDDIPKGMLPNDYIAKHQDDFDAFLDSYAKAIVPNSKAKLINFRDNSHKVMSVVKGIFQKADVAPGIVEAHQKVLGVSKLLRDIQTKVDGSVQTTNKFVKKVVDTTLQYHNAFKYAITSPIQVQKAAWENVIKKGSLIEFDLEGLNHDITEYAFAQIGFNPKTKENKEIIGYETGLIGISDERAKHYRTMLERYKKYGFNTPTMKKGVDRSEFEFVLRDLAQMGDSRSSWTWDDANKRAVRTGYPSRKDVRLDEYEKMEKGIQAYNDIYHQYQRNRVRFSYGGKDYDVFGYERDILSWLLKVKDENITLSTNNGLIYDNPELTKLLRGSTTDASRIFSDVFQGNLQSSIQHHFDVLPALRYMQKNGWVLNDKTINALLNKESDESLNSSGVLIDRFAPKAEVWAKELLGAERFVEHTGLPDTLKQALFKTNASILNPESKQYLFRNELPEMRDLAIGDLFMVDRGRLGSARGSMSYVYDPITATFNFVDNTRFNDRDPYHIGSTYQGAKKNTLMMLTDMRALEMTDEYVQAAKPLGLGAADKNLVALFFMPYAKDKQYFRDQQQYVIVATREEVQRRVSDGFKYVGNLDVDRLDKRQKKTGGRSIYEAAPYERAMLLTGEGNHDLITITEDSKTVSQLGFGEKVQLNRLLQYSAEYDRNDTASNYIRDMGYKKAEKINKVLSKIDKIVAQTQKDTSVAQNLMKARNEAMQSLMKDMRENGEKSFLAKTLQYYANPIAKEGLYINTNAADNIAKSLDFLYSMNGLYQKISGKIKSMGITDATLQDSYFRTFLGNAMAVIAEETGTDIKAVTGRMEKLVPRLNRDMNTFTVDLTPIMSDSGSSSVKGIYSSLDNLFPFSLEDGNFNIGTRLAKKLGFRDPKASSVVALRKLSNLLAREYGGKGADTYINKYEPTIASAGLIQQARDIRQTSPMAGIPEHVALMQVGMAQESMSRYASLSKEQQAAIDAIALDETRIPTFVSRTQDVERLANDYVDKYLFKQDVTVDDLIAKGHDERSARTIINDRELRKMDTRNFVQEVFREVLEKNKNIGYAIDQRTGALEFVTETGQRYDFTKNMFFDVYDENMGSFRTKLGGRMLNATVGLYGNSGDVPSAGVHSAIYSYVEEVKRNIRYMNDSRKSSAERLNYLQRMFSRTEETIAKYAITRYDIEDIRRSVNFSMEGLFDRLGYLAANGVYDNASFSNQRTADILEKLRDQYFWNVERGNSIDSKIAANDIAPLYRDIRNLLDPLRGTEGLKFFGSIDSRDYFFKNIYPELNLTAVKHPETHEFGRSYEHLPVFSELGKDPAHLTQVATRAHEFNYRDLLKNGYYDDLANAGYQDIIRSGSLFSGAGELAEKDYQGRATRLNIGTNAWHQLLDSETGRKILEKRGIKDSSVLYGYLNQGGTLMDPRLLATYDINNPQNINTKESAALEILDMEAQRNLVQDEIKRRAQTREVVQMVENGRVQFKYGGDVFMNRGEVMSIMESYRGTLDLERAIASGYMSVRYMKDGRVVSENEIEKILGRYSNELSMRADPYGVNMLNKVNEILSDEGMTRRILLRDADFMDTRKFVLTSEKSELTAPIANLGSIDKNIEKVLQGIGLSPSSSLRPSDYALQDMEHMSMMLEGAGGKKLTQKALSAGGFKDFEEFRKAALQERNALWFAAQDMLREAGYLRPDEAVSFIGDTLNAQLKNSHLRPMQLEATLESAVSLIARKKLGQSSDMDAAYKSATQELYNRLLGAGVFGAIDENGKRVSGISLIDDGAKGIRLANGYDIDLAQLRKTITDIETDYEGKVFDYRGNPFRKETERGKEGAILDRIMFSAVKGDADRPGFEKIRFTERMVSNMEQQLIGQSELERVRDAYFELQEASGKDKFDAVEEFNKRFDGIAQLKKAGDNEYKVVAEEGIIGSQLNTPLIQSLREQMIAGNRRNRVWISNKGMNEEATMLLEHGVSETELRSIYKNLQKQGYKNISSDVISKFHAFTTGREALDFNRRVRDMTLVAQEELTGELSSKAGFSVIKLEDIKDSFDQLFQNDPNRLNRAFIVDLGEKFQLDGGTRYLAVPFMNPSVMDENKYGEGVYSTDELITRLKSASRKASEIFEAGEARVDQRYSQIMQDLREVREGIVDAVYSKYGAMAEATSGYLPTSVMGKADILRIDEIMKDADNQAAHTYNEKLESHNKLLKTATVDGISLAERGAANVKTNAIFVNREMAEHMLMNDDMRAVLNKGGIDEAEALEEMLSGFEKTGSIGIALRQPQEYTNSNIATRIFYGRSLGNRLLLSEAAARAVNADKDGDQIYASMLTDRANIEINMTDKDGNVTTRTVSARLSQAQADYLAAVSKKGEKEFKVTFEHPEYFQRGEQAADILAHGVFTHTMRYEDEEIVRQELAEKLNNHPELMRLEIGGKVISPSRFQGREQQLAKQYNAIAGTNDFAAAIEEYNQSVDKESKKITAETMTADALAGESGIANRYLQRTGAMENSEAVEALSYQASTLWKEAEIANTMGRTNAGLANSPVYSSNRLINVLKSEGLTNLTERESAIIGGTMAHLLDAFQAAKNSSSAGLGPEDLSEAFRDFWGQNKTRTRDTSKLFSMLRDMSNNGDLSKELSLIAGGEPQADELLRAFGNIMPEGQIINPEFYKSLSAGVGIHVMESSIMNPDKNTTSFLLHKTADATFEELGLDSARMRSIDILAPEGSTNNILRQRWQDNLSSDIGYSEFQEASLKENLVGAFNEMKKRMSGSGAKWFFGAAAMTMLAGAMGGAPTSPTPADGQAQGIQAQDAMYELPSTMPGAVTGNGNNAGYIININASTDRGRDFAQTAINQAFAQNQQIGGNIQMTMNIKDSSTNISYGSIAQYITDML